MSGLDEAAKVRARQDREERRRAKHEAEERAAERARVAAEARRIEEQRFVAEVKAENGGELPSVAPVKAAPRAKPGNAPVLGSRDVPDPMEPGARLTATVNLAEHPLEMMLARRRLTPAQYEAGVRFRAIYERASIGPGRGIDPAKIKVDGGKLNDPLSDEVLHAQFELKGLARKLGPIGSRVVMMVAGQGVTVADLALRWPTPDSEKQKRTYLGMRLRDELEMLAEEVWGARGPERDRPAVVAERDLGTGTYDERAVSTANQRFMRRQGISGLVVNRDA